MDWKDFVFGILPVIIYWFFTIIMTLFVAVMWVERRERNTERERIKKLVDEDKDEKYRQEVDHDL